MNNIKPVFSDTPPMVSLLESILNKMSERERIQTAMQILLNIENPMAGYTLQAKGNQLKEHADMLLRELSRKDLENV